MITQEDLNWWLELAPTLEWTFAKTYTQTAPHHYVVEGRTPGMTHDDMVRVARVIATFGAPARYYSLTKIYLHSPDGRFRWWTEDRQFTDTTLVNRAPTDRLYGIQNALSTASSIDSDFDPVATFWDAENQTPGNSADWLRRLLDPVRGKFPPHVLDIGCGTGRVLDLGLVDPDRYAGVDSSRAMLNILVRKHPRVAALYPVDVRRALSDGLFTPGQFDWVFLDASIELSTDEREEAHSLARLAVINVDGGEWTVTDVSGSSLVRIAHEAHELRTGS